MKDTIEIKTIPGTRIIDLTGQKFNRLLVIEFFERKNNKTYWRCKCDCGNEK